MPTGRCASTARWALARGRGRCAVRACTSHTGSFSAAAALGAHLSTAAGRYLERMYDCDAAGFMKVLRTELFHNDDEFRAVFSNFQRHLIHLNPEQLAQVLEAAGDRSLRENAEGVDIVLLLLCEMNRRMLQRPATFSLKQTSRICAALKHVKFNRPSYLVADDQRAAPARGPGGRCRLDGSWFVVEPRWPGHSGQGKSGKDTSGQVADVVVPICEMNVGNMAGNACRACDGCRVRYGPLLEMAGHDQLALTIVLLGRSIVAQSAAIRKRHANAVANYLILAAHLNCDINAHLMRSIAAQYQHALAHSNSIRSIAIALQAFAKCRVRCATLRRRLMQRLADVGQFEALCAGERNPRALMIALNQIASALIAPNDLPLAPSARQVGVNLVTYLVDHFGSLSGSGASQTVAASLAASPALDPETTTSVRNSTRLLVDYLAHKGVEFGRILLDDGLDTLDGIVAGGVAEQLPTHFRTSDLHKQVSSVLQLLGAQPEEEVQVSPHMCDILLRKDRVVVEIDGPYHFNTSLNHSTNRLLKRDADDYRLTYTHHSKIKRFMLQLKGYRVVHVPYFSWPAGREEQLGFAREIMG